VHAAEYDSYQTPPRPSCFENTRVQLLDTISDWVHDENELQSIYILYGIAGIGKSTVAKTVAERAAGNGILGGSFFFSRGEVDRKTARSFFPTLAYQLALHYAEFAWCIYGLIEENRDVAQRDIRKQFNILIATPLRQMRVHKRTLIVIDALDECEDEDAETILTLLSRNIERPTHIKVFITARPEQTIRNVLSDRINHERFSLHDIEESIAEGDIRRYLQFRLSAGGVERALGPWQPTEGQLDKLVKMSGKVFIIASTATSFILDRKRSAPWERLNLLLDGVSPPDGSRPIHPSFMDHIYMKIIQAAQPEPPGNWVKLFQMVVGTIVLLHDPLPCKELAKLLGIDNRDVQSTLSNLHSLLAPKGENQTFRVHHKSFLDFITDSDCCKLGERFCINPTTHHLRIATHCLAVMDRDLKPNMCDLTPDEWGKDRAELHDHIHCISPALAYACTYWASHLTAGDNDETGSDAEVEVDSLLQNFASTRILIWLKTLSIIGRIDTAYVGLQVVTPDGHPDRPGHLNNLGNLFHSRFQRLGDIADLDEVITVKQQAVRLTPDGHPDKPGRLNDLGNAFQSRFERLGILADLDEAITVKQQAICLIPNDPNKPRHLSDLGNAFQSRFERLGNLADLHEAIMVKQQAVRLTPDGHPDKPGHLNNLGISFQSRFERFGDLVDLDQATTAQQLAVRLTLDSHPNKPGLLNNLGNTFQSRFERLGDLDDLDQAITAQHQAVRLTQDGHANKPRRLNNLGNAFQSRFERLGDLADLDRAITAQQQAVHLTQDGHPNKPRHLNNLGNAFQSRFERLGDLADLDEAITVKQQAISLTPDGHPDKPGHLNTLGTSLQSRSERLGGLADLDEAIMVKQQAVSLTPDGHPDKPGHLNTLGTSFQSRFERLGNLADLGKAITVKQQAVRLTPDRHPNKPRHLNNLGNTFQSRFERLGDLADLDEAITVKQQAVSLTPDRHPDKPGRLNSLGTSFQSRFERLGNLADLDEAITVKQQAVRLTLDGHPDKPTRLNNLSNSFHSRFERLGNLVDLDQAIVAQQQAVGLTPDGHPNKPTRLYNLGNSYHIRFGRLDDVADLHKAISTRQHAVHLAPDNHPLKPACLDGLSKSFHSRFERLGDVADLDKAISTQQHAVHLTPDGHSDKPQRLNDLGNLFATRLRPQPDAANLTQAISAFSQSAQSPSGPPSVRFTAARQWASLCFLIKSSEALDAYSVIANLLPRIAWLGGTVEQRYISCMGNVMADAVQTAIHFRKLNLALEWMEQGRSIVWGQMLQLRTPLDELHKSHPDEAASLGKISRALDSAAISNSDHFDPLAEVAEAHRRLAKEYGRTLVCIRDLPGFSEFLLPEKSASLCGAATSGPVITVNVHEARCDALIVLPHSSQVSHVPLPALQLSVVQDMHFQLMPDRDADKGLSDILGRLWSYVVEPILCHLKVSYFTLCPCFEGIDYAYSCSESLCTGRCRT